MLEEDLCWVEGVAKLTLGSHTVLEAFRKGFQLLVFLLKLIVLLLLLSNCLRKDLVRLLELLDIARWCHLRHCLLLADQGHQLLVHLPVLLELLLSVLELLLEMLLLVLPYFLLLLDRCLVEVNNLLQLLLTLLLDFFDVSFPLLIIGFLIKVVLLQLRLSGSGVHVDLLDESAVLRLQLLQTIR